MPASGQHVLDIGTGTGIWAIEYAEKHPSSSVVGIDITPVQHTTIPPNVEFHIFNAEESWAFEKGFDFIHVRMLIVGIKDWPRLFKQCHDNFNPGGWLEVQDLVFPLYCDDDSAGPDSPFIEWSHRIYDAALKAGIVMDASIHFAEYMQNLGFANIQEVPKIPLGPWAQGEKAKILGSFMHENISKWLLGLSLAMFNRVLGWGKEEVEADCLKVQKEADDPTKHIYSTMYVIFLDL